MSETEQNEDPRVLEEIDGKEISLVDHPAIERKFLIVKRLEDSVAREKIELADDEKEESADDAGAEKDAGEGPVAQDASQADIETDTASDGDEPPSEKAEPDPEAVMEAAAALMPWLQAQAAEADGELKAQLDALLEATGGEAAEGETPMTDGPEEEAAEAKAEDEASAEDDEEEDETEKSAEGWESKLDAVNASLADVAKGKDEEEDEMEKSADEAGSPTYVTAEQFDAFATKMTQAVATMAASVTEVKKQSDEVKKRADELDGFVPASNGGDDPSSTTEVNKSEDVFGSDFFEVRKRKLHS